MKIPFTLSAVHLVGIAGLCLLFALMVFSASAPSIDTRVEGIVAACKEATDKAGCYEAEVPALYPELSVAQVFEVIRQVRGSDPQYQFCHVLAHKLGERVVAEDPSRWIDAIPQNPADGLCSNGFVHGVTGGRFRAEVLSSSTIENFIGDFTAACAPRPSWQASNLDRAICYHGMGHLYDFITDADIPQALALCSRTTAAGYERMCIEGVFMQIFQPLEPDDFELIKRMEVQPTKENVRSYCASYEVPEYEAACLRESWMLFSDGIKDGTFAEEFCSWHPQSKRQECYQTVSSLVGRTSLEDVEKTERACRNFPEEWQWMCFGYSAEAALQENRTEAAHAVAICERAGGARERCYGHLLDHAAFIFGPNRGNYDAFCAALPFGV